MGPKEEAPETHAVVFLKKCETHLFFKRAACSKHRRLDSGKTTKARMQKLHIPPVERIPPFGSRPVLYSSVAPLKKRGSDASSIMMKSSSSSVTPTSMYSFTRLYLACSNAHWLPTFLQTEDSLDHPLFFGVAGDLWSRDLREQGLFLPPSLHQVRLWGSRTDCRN